MIALNYTLTLTPDTYDLMDDPNAKAYSGIVSIQQLRVVCHGLCNFDFLFGGYHRYATI